MVLGAGRRGEGPAAREGAEARTWHGAHLLPRRASRPGGEQGPLSPKAGARALGAEAESDQRHKGRRQRGGDKDAGRGRNREGAGARGVRGPGRERGGRRDGQGDLNIRLRRTRGAADNFITSAEHEDCREGRRRRARRTAPGGGCGNRNPAGLSKGSGVQRRRSALGGGGVATLNLEPC